MARDGLALDPGGDYLVATTQSSSADVQAYGRTIQLGRFSYALEPDQGPRGQAQRILVGAEDEAVPGQALGPRRRAHVTPRWPGALAPRPEGLSSLLRGDLLAELARACIPFEGLAVIARDVALAFPVDVAQPLGRRAVVRRSRLFVELHRFGHLAVAFERARLLE